MSDRRPSFGTETAAARGSPRRLGWIWLDQLRQDLAYAARTFWRSPGFTLARLPSCPRGRREPCRVPGLPTPGSSTACHFKAPTVSTASLVSLRTGNLRPFLTPPLAVYRQNCSLWLARALGEQPVCRLLSGIEGGLRTTFVSGNYFGALRILPRLGACLLRAMPRPVLLQLQFSAMSTGKTNGRRPVCGRPDGPASTGSHSGSSG